jgi:hypothetical protein
VKESVISDTEIRECRLRCQISMSTTTVGWRPKECFHESVICTGSFNSGITRRRVEEMRAREGSYSHANLVLKMKKREAWKVWKSFFCHVCVFARWRIPFRRRWMASAAAVYSSNAVLLFICYQQRREAREREKRERLHNAVLSLSRCGPLFATHSFPFPLFTPFFQKQQLLF